MFEDKYKLWCEKAVKDPDLISELKAIENDSDAISDAFYKILNSERAVFAEL